MAQYAPEELGFLDKLHKDERTVGRRYGRSKWGQRARQRQPFIRGRRTSTEVVISVDGVVASTVVEGSMTKELFLEFLELQVVRECIFFVHNIFAHGPAASKVLSISGTAQCPRDG
jgi:hypothetical protein